VFLLVYRGEQKSWHLPEAAGAVDFNGLVEALQERWMVLSPRLSNVDDIQVIGIDLTRRAVAA
jgi:3-oxoacyl-(acyl-carrier-protein) synthase